MYHSFVATISPKEISGALLSQKWIYAKTQPRNPHEYCLRNAWSAKISFDDLVMYIRQHGYKEMFGHRVYTYCNFEGYRYWTMGSPLRDTILINRARNGES
jgi:hypothetical protein